MTTHSIKSGGDYTTITAFEADADTYWSSNSDVFHGEIQEDSQFDESNITISFTETPTSTKYLELSTATANFPSNGVFSTSKAYLTQGGSSHIISVSAAYTYLHHLQVYMDGTGSSDEGTRVNSDNVLISYCIYKGYNDLGNQAYSDAIFTSTADITLCVDNCVFYDWSRSSVNNQKGGSPNTTIYIDHCFAHNRGKSTYTTGFGPITTQTVDQTWRIYNCAAIDCECRDFVEDGRAPATGSCSDSAGTWNDTQGSNNIASDTTAETSFTSSYNSVSFTETSPTSGENYWVEDESAADFRIAGENAYTVTQNGTDRTGSEPDSRQDFSIDILGNTRSSTPNIGPFAFGDGIAGGTDIDCGTASQALAGVNATVNKELNITLLDADQALAGVNATIGQGTTITALAASQALDAPTLNINKEKTITLFDADQALDGPAAGINKEKNIDLNLDEQALDAPASSVNKGKTITLGLDEQSLDAPVAGVNKERTFTLLVDEQALEGVNASIELGGVKNVECGVSEQVLVAVTLNVNNELTLALTDAEQALEAEALEVNQNRIVTANAAEQVLQGVSTTVSKAFVVMTGTADQALQGVFSEISIDTGEVLEPYTIGGGRIIMPQVSVRKRKGRRQAVFPREEAIEKTVEQITQRKVEKFEFKPTEAGKIEMVRESVRQDVYNSLMLTIQQFNAQEASTRHMETVEVLAEMNKQLTDRLNQIEDSLTIVMALQ